MNATAAFLLGLKFLESGGDYQVVNSLNYLGAYQFGEGALVDLGYVRSDGNYHDNDYSGGWTGQHGIRSAEAFLQNPSVQDLAADAWLPLMWSYIGEKGLQQHLGETIAGIEMTPAAMLAASHLLGPTLSLSTSRPAARPTCATPTAPRSRIT